MIDRHLYCFEVPINLEYTIMKNYKSFKKFLDPNLLRSNINKISLYICLFEMLKDAVEDKARTFFADISSTKFKDGKIISNVTKDYETYVLCFSKKYIDTASLKWLETMGAVNDLDIEAYRLMREHRNSLVHEMFSFLVSEKQNIDNALFESVAGLYVKIEKWWFVNFEMAIDPDICPEGSDPNDAMPMEFVVFNMLVEIATGSEKEEGYYLKKFIELISLDDASERSDQ